MPDWLALDYLDYWELTGLGKDHLRKFLLALPVLFDEGCVLALDDVDSDMVRAFLSTREPDEKPKLVALDECNLSLMIQFFPPSVEKHHKRPAYMRMTAENLQALADMLPSSLQGTNALVVYRDQEVLLEYNDIHVEDAQVQIAGSVDEEQVREFCGAIGFAYSRTVSAEGD